MTFQIVVPGLLEPVLDSAGFGDAAAGVLAPSDAHRIIDSLASEVESLTSCACGLELPLRTMVEHMQSTGHEGVVSFGSVRAGKIWDLEEAMIEGISPDCYKCGRPVKGLRRVGRTIYVSHLGCIDAGARRRRKGEMDASHGPMANASVDRASRTARRGRCPICWNPVYRRRGSTQSTSSTGGVLRFHDNCLRLEA